MGSGKFAYVFTDLWHDVSDGLGLYERMKNMKSNVRILIFHIELRDRFYVICKNK